MNHGIYGGISICFLMRYRNYKFQNRNSDFLTLQTSEFKKYFPTRIFGIKNGIRIPLAMGVPEIVTKNQNSQPRLPLLCWCCRPCCAGVVALVALVLPLSAAWTTMSSVALFMPAQQGQRRLQIDCMTQAQQGQRGLHNKGTNASAPRATMPV